MGTKGRWNFGIKTSDLIGSTEADDDTVLAGKQAREDAMNAMIESGLLDSQFGKHMWMESEEDVAIAEELAFGATGAHLLL